MLVVAVATTSLICQPEEYERKIFPPFFLSFLMRNSPVFSLQKKHFCAGFSILEKVCFLSTSSYNFFPVFQEISLNPDVEPCPTAWSGHLGPIPVNFGKEHMLCKTGLVLVKLYRTCLVNYEHNFKLI